MKILIVSRHFAPENTVGAIRWTKFAKYLARLGHEVTVYAMEPGIRLTDPLLQKDAEGLRVFSIGHGRFYTLVHDFFARRDPTAGTGKTEVKAALTGDAAAKKSSPALAGRLLKIAYKVMALWVEKDFVGQYRRFTRADSETYDAVIGTWSTDASLKVALDMKKRGRAKRFVADYRDAVAPLWPELTRGRDTERMLDDVYRHADLVTMVIPEQVAENRVPEGLPRMVLTNGFDPEDLASVPAEEGAHAGIRLVYLGQIYPGMQDFTPLFRAVGQLIAKGRAAKDTFTLVYGGQSFPTLWEQAKACGMEHMLENRGFLPRDRALALERSADLLLFTAWDNGRTEVLPAKFLEYMMIGRPVLALIGGVKKDRLSARVMRETGLGFVCENADPESCAGLTEYLASAAALSQKGEKLPYAPDEEALSAYAYPALAKRLSERLSELTKEDKKDG